MSAVPAAVIDGIYELEERAAFLSVACAALAEKPDAAGLLDKKSLQGLAWWTQDLEGRLRELDALVSAAAP